MELTYLQFSVAKFRSFNLFVAELKVFFVFSVELEEKDDDLLRMNCLVTELCNICRRCERDLEVPSLL